MNGTNEPRVFDQGVYNKISLPLNDDYMAVSHAISDLLTEGWMWSGIDKVGSIHYLVLAREWKC